MGELVLFPAVAASVLATAVVPVFVPELVADAQAGAEVDTPAAEEEETAAEEADDDDEDEVPEPEEAEETEEAGGRAGMLITRGKRGEPAIGVARALEG